MGNTWGISSAAFLTIYVALMVVVGTGVWVLLKQADRRGATGDPSPAPDATVEDLALLSGGRVRLVQVAVTRLVDAGALRVATDRKLSATGAAAGGELDAAVLAEAEGGTWRRRTTTDVVKAVQSGPAVEALAEDARSRGLLLPESAVARVRTIGFVLLGAVVVLGVVRTAAGIANGKAVGFLIMLIFVTLFGVVVVASLQRVRPTARGRATLAAARTTGTRRGGSSSLSPGVVAALGGAVGMVALGGLALHPDSELSTLLAAPPGGGGGGFAGGGGGCGGGGGGGGGCGG